MFYGLWMNSLSRTPGCQTFFYAWNSHPVISCHPDWNHQRDIFCSVDTRCRNIHFHSAWDMLWHLSVSFYHLDQASSPLYRESSWVLTRDAEKTPGSRFVKLLCVIHFLTSFTRCDSFGFWAAGYKGLIFRIGASEHAFNVMYYSSRHQT